MSAGHTRRKRHQGAHRRAGISIAALHSSVCIEIQFTISVMSSVVSSKCPLRTRAGKAFVHDTWAQHTLPPNAEARQQNEIEGWDRLLKMCISQTNAKIKEKHARPARRAADG